MKVFTLSSGTAHRCLARDFYQVAEIWLVLERFEICLGQALSALILLDKIAPAGLELIRTVALFYKQDQDFISLDPDKF